MTSALSHEITQPITAARSLARAAQLRMDTQLSPDLPRLRENLGEIVKQIDLAAAILSRMRAFIGRGTPERQTVIIGDVLIDTLSLIGPRAAAHHITITSNITPNLPQAACDPIQIQQVLMNLIGNAIDAIVAGGVTGGVTGGVGTTTDAGAWTNTADRQRSGAHIMLDVTEARGSAPDTGRITICVRDNGPGVPADLAPHVFDALTTDKAGGLGLGLSICALIVEAHGGRIWLENPGPGGTEFRFWLPTMPGAADAG